MENNNTHFFNNLELKSSEIPFSPSWRKELIAKIWNIGFPAVFNNLEDLKDSDVKTWPKNSSFKDSDLVPLTFKDLKGKAGIYMLRNNITKKFYIGRTSNLFSRLRLYLNLKTLETKKSARIHRALLKFGHKNFSVFILELKALSNMRNYSLIERENFFIQLFNPQYNIVRLKFKLPLGNTNSKSSKDLVLPIKVQALFRNCLDPQKLDWHFLRLSSFINHVGFWVTAITPKGKVYASSRGWRGGEIVKNSPGYILDEKITLNFKNNPSLFKVAILYLNILDLNLLNRVFVTKAHVNINFKNSNQVSIQLKKKAMIKKLHLKGIKYP